jgi:putative transposon-encoded protein
MKVSEKRYVSAKIEKSLNEIHIVKPNGTSGHITIPKCMIGMRVKIILIGDKQNGKN